jgi:sterol desaturase/sphingolipid hydroxylase (fatty acid hydroxylase superfamily)
MNTLEKILLFGFGPAVLLMSFVEATVLARRESYDWRAYGISLLDFAGRIAVTIFLPHTIAAPLVDWVTQHRLGTIAVDSFGAFILLFVMLEFCYYWLHRVAHRVRWFWCNHAVHHTSNQLNLGASLRIGMFGKATGNVVFLLPMVWIGFDLRLVLAALSINLLYQFWLHATWFPKLGWLERVLNTPSAHRVHHAANLPYLDANYGGVLIVFDRLFGTYTAERDDLPCRYGLVKPMTSHNPLRVEFGQWLALGADLLRARSLRAVLGYLVMPPGWSPDGRHETTEALRENAQPSHRRAGTPPCRPGRPGGDRPVRPSERPAGPR